MGNRDVRTHAIVHDGLLLPFDVVDDELQVGGIGIRDLTRQVGSTPYYAYDRSIIDKRLSAMRGWLPKNIELHYAVKANPMPALVAWMAQQVDGFDVASAGELQLALDAGMSPQDISFAGPGKRESELSRAVAAGVLVNIESFREIKLLVAIAAATGKTPRVAIRVNPDFGLRASGMLMGGGPMPFGIDAEHVPKAIAEVKACGLHFEGFHIFWGSQNLDATAICDAQRLAMELALRLSRSAAVRPHMVNLGGGFGIPYFPGQRPLDTAAVGENLAQLSAALTCEFSGARLVIELGRYLVGEAGVYVCRVLERKVSRGEVFLITDGGLHHHLAASGNFGQKLRKNFPLMIGNRMKAADETVSVVGPLCTPLDLLGDRVLLPHAEEGDLLVIGQSGAYGFSASPLRFLGHPEPIEVIV